METGKCKQDFLVWGESGVGKTALFGMFARFLYLTTGLRSRLVSCSGGSWDCLVEEIREGFVIPTQIYQRKAEYEALDRLTQGWWPSDPADPTSPLLAPPYLKHKYTAFKPERFQPQGVWDNIGMTAFDGMSEIADRMLDYTVMLVAEGKLKIISAKSDNDRKAEIPISFQDGETKFGNADRSYYMQVQHYLKQFVQASKYIPGQYIYWTALPTDTYVGPENNRTVVSRGPQACGAATKDKNKAWFSNVFHLMKQPERRLYLKDHKDPSDILGIPAMGKIAVSPYAVVPDYLGPKDLEAQVDGKINLKAGIPTVLEVIAKANEEARKYIEECKKLLDKPSK